MKKEQIISVVLIFLTIVGLYYIKNNTTDETVVKEPNEIIEKNEIQEKTKQDAEVFNELYVSEFDIEKILSKKVPVYLHFGAEWCGPCQEMKPYVEKLHKKYGSEMVIMYIDVDKVNIKNFPIQAVPTQFFFNNEGRPLLNETLFNEIKNFSTYENQEGVHGLTAHVGLLTEEQLVTIFKNLGLEVE